MARRQFASGSDVFCQIEVFGAKKDEKTGQPVVRQGYEVRRADGSVLTSMAPSVIRPTSLGAVNRMFGFRLADAAPGRYELFMTLRDDVAGNSLEVHEPFEVLPPGSLPVPSMTAPAAQGAPGPGTPAQQGAPAAAATPPGGGTPQP